MKKVNLLLVFVLFITLFSACKKEEKEVTPKQNLVGKTWIVTNSSTEVSTSFGLLPPELINDLNPLRNVEGQTMVFNADGTFQLGTDTASQGKWTLSEDNQKLTFTGLVEGDLTGFIDAQTLTDLQTFEVITLTETKLGIKNENDVPIPTQVTGLPLPITATIKLEITFDKQ